MPCNFNLLTHEGIQNLKPYIPGKSIAEVAKEQGLTHIIKLASNENPLGCSPKALQALHNLSSIEVATYPLATIHPLRYKLAEQLGVEANMITFGNGTDSLFPLFMMCFALHNHKHIIIPEYSFVAYGVHAHGLGVPVVSTPVHQDWTIDVDTLIDTVNENTALIYLANPNNPTGSMTEYEEIERMLKNIPETTILVVDEAYYEFLDTTSRKSALLLMREYTNLIVTRTFSKIYGLASLRLGYCVAHEQMTEIFHKVLPPFTVNQASLVAAEAALDDDEFIKQSFLNNIEGMQQMEAGLADLKLSYLKPAGNFVTVDFKKDAKPLYEDLQRLGIIVRPLHSYNMANYLRVSIGTPTQNREFFDKLKISLETF